MEEAAQDLIKLVIWLAVCYLDVRTFQHLVTEEALQIVAVEAL